MSRDRLSGLLRAPEWILLGSLGAVLVGALWLPEVWRHHVLDVMASRVGATYGDPHPRFERVVPEWADPNHERMYFVYIQGHFKDGSLTADHISFCALANGKKLWLVRAMNDDGSMVWLDGDFPPTLETHYSQ